MENLHSILLVSHIATGFMALASGIIPMVAKKGGKLHRLTGQLFFWSMFWVFLSSVISFFFFRGNFFLLVIGIFSFHMCFTGYRILYRRKPGGEKWYDWAGAIITLIAGAAVEIHGIYLLSQHGLRTLVILSMVFGLFTMNNAWGDIKLFQNPERDGKMWWLYHHISAFCGAFIATITAFLVNAVSGHVPGQLSWIIWLLPVACGAPGIAMWIRHYKRKYGDLPAKQTAPSSATAPNL
ncbi:MAG: hypothetical protein AAFO94_04050 [Bacteroidota bacterium]